METTMAAEKKTTREAEKGRGEGDEGMDDAKEEKRRGLGRQPLY
jgi:hypothetical protein